METLLLDVAALGAVPFGILLFALQIVALEAGFVVGRRRSDGRGEPPAGVGIVVGGMLTLLGFVLALTLSSASGRFEARRAGTLAEANAIGTAWLRAKAIGHPRGEDIARQIVDYTHLRMDFVSAGFNAKELDAINSRTNTMQTEIWHNLTDIVHDRQDAVAAQLMAALNDMFDSATAERFAFAFIVPQLVWLIIGLAILSVAGVGYQLGLRGVAVRTLSILLIGMWTVVATLILDLGSPRLGSIRTGTAAYEWTLSGFGPAPKP